MVQPELHNRRSVLPEACRGSSKKSAMIFLTVVSVSLCPEDA